MPRPPLDLNNPFEEPVPLFKGSSLSDTLQFQRRELVEEINGLDRDYLLGVGEHDLICGLGEKYRVQQIVLLKEKIEIDGPREVPIDVSNNILYSTPPGGHRSIPGIAFTAIIPFEGDELLLRCQPDQWEGGAPHARISQQEIHLEFRSLKPDADAARKFCEDALSRIGKHLAWGSSQVQPYNDGLNDLITKTVVARKEKLLADFQMVAALPYKLRRRDVPTTYAVPSVRRKPKIELPRPFVAGFQPEPELVTEDYNFILKVIQDMTLVMERSPHAFARMEEEHLRDHFLVQLNGHFEGAATGETFNADGKTDILIRHENRNVFIAECKFWKGDRVFGGTIDQLLGYTSWRDTKTAILVFNRNRDMTKVLEKIPSLVKGHANFKRELPQSGETQFRYILRHRDDANRDLILTVMVFNVPTENTAE